MLRNPIIWVCRRRCLVKLLRTHDLLPTNPGISFDTIFKCQHCNDAIEQDSGMPVLVPMQLKDALDQLAAI